MPKPRPLQIVTLKRRTAISDVVTSELPLHWHHLLLFMRLHPILPVVSGIAPAVSHSAKGPGFHRTQGQAFYS